MIVFLVEGKFADEWDDYQIYGDCMMNIGTIGRTIVFADFP
jgi:hypothetical protein